MKRLTAHIKKVNPDREAAFKSSAQAAVKKVCVYTQSIMLCESACYSIRWEFILIFT